MKNNNDMIKFLIKIDKNNFIEKCALFIWGVFIYALSFSLFFSPRGIVTGGSLGLSLIFNNLMHIDKSLFVFGFSVITLILAYLFLGRYYAMKTVLGVILLPIFMQFTEIFNSIVDFGDISLFLLVFIAGILMGLGNGIIIRSGFSVGGIQTICQIIYKYFGVSVGKSLLIINGTLVFLGGFSFGISSILYASVGVYVSSIITDRVILETSLSKTFFIVTKHYRDINDYIIEVLGHGATILDARGGYKDEKQKILMCNVPTRKYYQTKEVIKNIDKDAFFLISDTYEIYGGV